MDETDGANKIKTTAFLALLRRLNNQITVVKEEQVILEYKLHHYNKIFKDLAEFEEWLKDPENIKGLIPGMNVYFVDTDIADLWFDGKTFHVLEAEKVDLSPFVKKTEAVQQIHDEIGREKGVPHGIAALTSDAQVGPDQLRDVEMIANRGHIYPTLERGAGVQPEKLGKIPDRFLDLTPYEFVKNKG